MNNNQNIVGLCLVFSVIVFLIFGFSLRSFTKNSCSTVPLAKIIGISKTDENYQHNLHDYYIKSSYNSCSNGEFQNDWVNLCALDNVIKQGCRVLDFEIYQVDGETVVATSNSTKVTEKGTFNSLSIDSVIKLISEKAVSNSLSTEHCPNPYDPLFLHFRIKTNKIDVYNQLAKVIVQYLDSKLLSNEHSYENQGKNLGEEHLSSLMGKVIIIVDKMNSNHIRSTKMEELVNIMGNSPFLFSLHYNDIVHTTDMDNLIDHNKTKMTIGYPNLSSSSKNYNSSILMQYGVQMPCMCFQTNDNFLKTYNRLFENAGHAFMLKPELLRSSKPVMVKEASPINPALSYGYNTYSNNLYNFDL